MKFGILSAVPIVLLGLVLGQTQRGAIRQRALGDARQLAIVVAHLGIQPQLAPSDLSQGLGPDGVARLDHLFKQSGVLGGEVARLRIWSADSKVVYSDDHSSIGRTFDASSELQEALDGEVASEISDLSSAENAGDRSYGSLLEVYVPLHFDSDARAAGAFEIYLPYRPIEAAIASDVHDVEAVLLGGLALLYLVLFRIVWGASRQLRRRATENEYLAVHDPLTDLPNRRLFQDWSSSDATWPRATG